VPPGANLGGRNSALAQELGTIWQHLIPHASMPARRSVELVEHVAQRAG
jgi:hypothetical protein